MRKVHRHKDDVRSGNETVRSTHSRFSPMKFSSFFVRSLKPWSLSASLWPVLLGSVIAYKTGDEFRPAILVLVALITSYVHGAGNLASVYTERADKGDDVHHRGDRLSQKETATLGVILYGLACLCFVVLATLSPARLGHLALLFSGELFSCCLLTSGFGSNYAPIGDLTILLFGPISLMFSFLAQTGQTFLIGPTAYYAIPMVAVAEAILHSTNVSHVSADRQAGVVTLATLIGVPASVMLFTLLVYLPFVVFGLWAVFHSKLFLLPFFSLPFALRLDRMFRSQELRHQAPKMATQLSFYEGLLYILAVGLCPIDFLFTYP